MWTSYPEDGEPDPQFVRRMSPPDNGLVGAVPPKYLSVTPGDGS
jgi:hypothetical protein